MDGQDLVRSYEFGGFGVGDLEGQQYGIVTVSRFLQITKK